MKVNNVVAIVLVQKRRDPSPTLVLKTFLLFQNQVKIRHMIKDFFLVIRSSLYSSSLAV